MSVSDASVQKTQFEQLMLSPHAQTFLCWRTIVIIEFIESLFDTEMQWFLD